MRAAKEQHGALPADLLADVTQFAMPALAGQAARLAARLRLVEWLSPFNLIISNVPGPNIPLYYAGARLLAYYPLSAIADGQGLNITVMSLRRTACTSGSSPTASSCPTSTDGRLPRRRAGRAEEGAWRVLTG